jgi:putative membrane protein
MPGVSARLPYCGAPPVPGDLWHRFNLDPVLIGALIILLVLHLRALRTEPGGRLPAVAGWLIAAAALISPLCALSVSLFSARIAQHMVLLLVAAPLIAMAWPRSMAPRRAWSLWASAAFFFVALWFWHMPVPYDATFQSSIIYWSMHITLFGSGILLWRELLQHRDSHTLDALAVALLSSLQMGLLGAVLTFASRPLYLSHLATAGLWGYMPLEDQQLGGVLMWVPGVLLFLWAGVRSLRRLWMALETAEPS